jgi:prepilin-type processing-associated H-X9-DG protein
MEASRELVIVQSSQGTNQILIFNMAFLDGHTEAVRNKDFGPMDTSPFYLKRWNSDSEP